MTSNFCILSLELSHHNRGSSVGTETDDSLMVQGTYVLYGVCIKISHPDSFNFCRVVKYVCGLHYCGRKWHLLLTNFGRPSSMAFYVILSVVKIQIKCSIWWQLIRYDYFPISSNT